MLPQAPQTTVPTIEDIWAYISAVDADLLLLESELPEAVDGAYARLQLLKEPFEVTLIKWPVGGKSAIHKHDGFYGAVRVLKGRLVNRTYEHHSAVLEETEVAEFTSGGIVEEADGTIHLLENSSEEESISLHVYYPAIASFQDMHLYNIEEGAIGVLGPGAKSASWKSEEPNHFQQIQQHAFSFKGIASSGSHYITPIVPKPSKGEILHELGMYYDEQAKQYDGNDLNIAWRKKYTEGVNRIIAVELMKRRVDDYLALCCGTGRRPLEIKALTGKDFNVYGVDISQQMVAESEKRGLMTKCGDITSVQFKMDKTYDCITYLYAFGHLTCREDRLEVLRKCKQHLNPGGVFFADLFCLRNIFEWGGAIQKQHEKYSLEEQGYTGGDIFYKRSSGKHRAFLHYFTREEILALFLDAGFEEVEIQKIGYTNRPGQLHDTSDEGMYWVKAW